MKNLRLSVEIEVFRKCPSFCRGLVVADGLKNDSDVPKLKSLMAEALMWTRANPIDLDNDCRILIWKEAHQRFGSNPNRYPPAHLAIRKRVQRIDGSIPFINNAVAIMNLVSLQHVLPVGGDDLDYVTGMIQLRLARGDEFFVPLDKPDTIERPEPGELVYVDESGQILARRWNWRNGSGTRIRHTTCRIAMNIDGLGEGALCKVKQARDSVAELFSSHCDARVQTGILSVDSPYQEFHLPENSSGSGG